MANSDVIEAEATSNTDAKTTTTAASAVTAKAAVADPVKGEAASAAKPDASKVETKTEAKTEAKPEPVELAFNDPEGKPITGPVITAFTEMAKEHGWTQEIADGQLGRLAQGLRDAHTAAKAEWDAAIKADKEIGGEKLAENLGIAKKAIEKIGGADYLKHLEKAGLDPMTLKAWVKVGKAISQDKFTAGVPVVGRPGDIASPNDTSVAAFSKHYATTPSP